MEILFTIEFYEPHKGGAEEVVKQLSERLVLKGHNVTVATSATRDRQFETLNGVCIKAFAISGNIVKGIKGFQKEKNRYQNFLKEDFDIILNYAAQTWTTDLALDFVGATKAKWAFVPCGYSGLYNHAYKEYFERLPAYLAKYDAIVYMSENYQDKKFGDAHGVGNKAVIIPNGAAEEEFLVPDEFHIREKLGITTPHLLICVANHYCAKGHRFIINAFRLTKRKDTTLLIVGEALVSSGIRKLLHFILDYIHCRFSSITNNYIRLVSGKNRALALSAYKNADLFMFGSQIETAPLVVYESFAAKVPVITTNVGNVNDHKDVLKIVATPAEMAEEINFLLDNKDAHDALATRAYTLWQNNYTWRIIAERYEELFISLGRRKE